MDGDKRSKLNQRRDARKVNKEVNYLLNTMDAEKVLHPIGDLHNAKGFSPVTNLKRSDLAYLLHCKWGIVIVKWDLEKGEWVPVHWTLRFEPNRVEYDDNDGVWKLHSFFRKTTLFHRNILEDGELARAVDELMLDSRKKLEAEMKKFGALCKNVNKVNKFLSRTTSGTPDVSDDDLYDLLL